MPSPGIDFFRVDRSGRTRRLLIVAAVLVTLGASSIGAHLMHRLAPLVGHVVSLLGGVTMLAGLLTGFGTMAMMLFENVYLAIADDGVLVHDNGRETKIRWDDLTGVEVEGRSGLIVLVRREAESLRFHAGKAAADVASRLREARRKGAHGLLRTGSSSPPPA